MNTNETPTIEELESQYSGKPGFIEYPMLPWNERHYGQSLMRDKPRDEPLYSIDEVLDIFRKLQGTTIIRVFEASHPDGTTQIGYHNEPAYTTEEGIKKARWKWMEWLRGLHAGERREYLDLYETK